jgi:hypothetical protein
MNRSLFALSVAAVAAAMVAGCETPQQTNTLGGAVLGGAGGALVGSAVTHGSAGGALAGGAIGAATGAVVGSAATPPSGRCAQWGYDNVGNPVCVAFY